MVWTQHADTLLSWCSVLSVTIPAGDRGEVRDKDELNDKMEPSFTSVNLQFLCTCTMFIKKSQAESEQWVYNLFLLLLNLRGCRIAVQLYSACVAVGSAHVCRGGSVLACAYMQDATYAMSGGGGGRKSSGPGGERGEPES